MVLPPVEIRITYNILFKYDGFFSFYKNLTLSNVKREMIPYDIIIK